MLNAREILTTAQMRAIESAAIDGGTVTGLQLMERAGAAVAEHILGSHPRPGHALILCGPGNNGGDGYVVARHMLHAGWRVSVMGLENTPGPDAAVMKARWLRIGTIMPLNDAVLRDAPQADIYVDAIFGTGLTRPVAQEIRDIVTRLGGRDRDARRYAGRLFAIDCPSGLCLDSGKMLGWTAGQLDNAPRAIATIAFDCPKPGHLLHPGQTLCGEVHIADIGLGQQRREIIPTPKAQVLGWPRSAREPSRQEIALRLAKDGDGHKYRYGHAVVVAGGIGRGGAARLAARSALRIGAGLVTLCPPSEAMLDHGAAPDALMRRAIEDSGSLTRLLTDKRINSICIGPGCGVGRAIDLLPAILRANIPCLLDADALSAIAAAPELCDLLHENCILTPHQGEFTRLFPDLAERLSPASPEQVSPCFSRLDAVQQAARSTGATILLKGPDTTIADTRGHCRIICAPDVPWLATAGAGDVLSGMISGLQARALPRIEAASIAAMLHAAAARNFGPGLIADDLPEGLPVVLKTD